MSEFVPFCFRRENLPKRKTYARTITITVTTTIKTILSVVIAANSWGQLHGYSSHDGSKVVRWVEADCRDHSSGARGMPGIAADNQGSERLEFQPQEQESEKHP